MLQSTIPELAIQGKPVVVRTPVVPWRRVLSVEAADGVALIGGADPGSLHAWFLDNTNRCKEVGQHDVARIFTNGGAWDRLELYPLFSGSGASPTATAKLQLWGLDAISPQWVQQIAGAEKANLLTEGVVPNKNVGMHLGVPYLMSRDSAWGDSDVLNLSARAESAYLSFPAIGLPPSPVLTTPVQPIPRDQGSGILYYLGQRVILSHCGFYAFATYVTELTANTTLTLLARFS